MEFLSRQTVRLPRWAIFVSPGRIHLTGRHVGDIAAERDGDVPGRGGGPAEMDGDVLRDDDPVQHPRHPGEGRGRAAAAVAGKQHMGWDGDGLGRGFPCGQSVSVPAAGQKLRTRITRAARNRVR